MILMVYFAKVPYLDLDSELSFLQTPTARVQIEGLEQILRFSFEGVKKQLTTAKL